MSYLPSTANHILVGDQALQQERLNVNQRSSIGRHSIGGSHVPNHSILAQNIQSSWQQPATSRPVASKNMPQCFRARGGKARDSSLNHSNVNNTAGSAQKRSFSNDARLILQQQQRVQPGVNDGNMQNLIHTAEAKKRANFQMHPNNGYQNNNLMGMQAAAVLANSNIAPVLNATNNDLSRVHQMFPAFAVSTSPRVADINAFKNELWEDDPFKQSLM